jgi:ribosomal subunit interface protein
MKTLVSIPHHEYPTSTRDQVEAKLQHLARFYDRIVSIRAMLERQADAHRVELITNVGHGVTLVVDARGDALEATLDEALARMSRVLKRHKTKLTDRARRSGRRGH